MASIGIWCLASQKSSINKNVYHVCRFLFDESSADYKYYEYQLAEEEKALSQNIESKSSNGLGFPLDSHILFVESKYWCHNENCVLHLCC